MSESGRHEPKPVHLGPQYGAQFGDAAVIRAYRHRPPYPDELFAELAHLAVAACHPESDRVTVLDAGCGTGDLALGMLANIPGIERLDAIDISAGMVAEGRRRSGGDDPRITWQVAPIETARLNPPYSLVTAGESLHWMDWSIVMPRFRDALLPGGVLAIAGRSEQQAAWTDGMLEIVRRYSTNRDFQPYNLVDELTSRRLFTPVSASITLPVVHTQSVDDYIESWHSRNGISRDRMTHEAATAFDDEARELLFRLGYHNSVTFTVTGTLTWGLPDG